jgi:hypothetical protein
MGPPIQTWWSQPAYSQLRSKEERGPLNHGQVYVKAKVDVKSKAGWVSEERCVKRWMERMEMMEDGLICLVVSVVLGPEAWLRCVSAHCLLVNELI